MAVFPKGLTTMLRAGAMRTLSDLETWLDENTPLERGNPARAMIEPYRSFGTGELLHVKGRLLEERGIVRAESASGAWRAALATARRAWSREIPGVRVRATAGEASVEGVTDAEGYFHLRLPSGSRQGPLWRRVALEASVEGRVLTATASVLVPPQDAAVGIVSDIDDTVVPTGATSLIRMLRTVALEDAHVRHPFEGVPALYRALHRDRNPLFYVSSGPWNLYDLLDHLFELRGIPPGPFFLQDWGLEPEKFFVGSHDAHKKEQILSILEAYPALPFLLIGDSGQRDPEIYTAIAEEHRGRVEAIYIRDVTDARRKAQIQSMAATLTERTGARLLLVADSLEAAVDARAHGWIDDAGLEEVRREMSAEAAAETEL